MDTPAGSIQTPSKSGLISPRKRFLRSPKATVPPEQLFEGNDDEAEKQKRRIDIKNAAFRSPAHGLGTPRRAVGRRSGITGGNGMDQGQLAEHYANCIKLSSENKINAKNAFGLHLIDYMADMLREQGGLTNFQVAGCTLDASAKIYSGRVDSIYADAYKMLGGLGAQDRRPARDGDDGEEAPGDGDRDHQRQSKAKKRMRHSQTVEQNVKNLNVNKFDLEFEVDPLFQKTSATFDEGGPRGLLLNQLAISSATCEVILDSNTVVMPTIGKDRAQATPATTTHDPCMLDLTNMRDHLQQLRIDGLEICSEFADFSFMNGTSKGLHSVSGTWSVSDLLAKTTPSKARAHSEFHYDINASSGDDDCFDDAGAANYDDGDGADGFPATECREGAKSAGMLAEGSITAPAKMLGDVGLNGIGDKMVVVDPSVPGSDICLSLSTHPSEYSYFDKQCLVNWAGPKHWRIHPPSKESSTTSETGGDKPKERKKAFRIDFEAKFDAKKAFVQTKATTLTKAALSKRSDEMTTLPEDLHFDPNQLNCLFIKPKWRFVLVAKKEEEEKEHDGELPWYNYNNARDCEEFCPAALVNDDDDGVGTQGGFTLANNSLGDTFSSTHSGGDITHMPSFLDQTAAEPSMLAGNNLVAQPRMVQRIQIDYAKAAKRVDVKKLKGGMWSFMTRSPSSEKENVSEKTKEDSMKDGKVEQSSVVGEQEFSSVYTALPGLISHSMAKNISVPIVFVCLLHLANEKVLKITGNAKRDNLIISQDHS